MVRVIILAIVRQDQSRFEAAKNFRELAPVRKIIRERPIKNVEVECRRFKQARGVLHFPAAHGRQVRDRFGGLALVTLAANANGDHRAVPGCPSQCAGAQQFGVVRVSDYGENAFLGKAQVHNFSAA